MSKKTMRASSRKKSRPRGTAQAEKWVLGMGLLAGKLLIGRVNTQLQRLAGDPRYRHRVDLVVPFKHPDLLGLPDDDEDDDLDRIEQVLSAEFRDDKGTLMAAVLTSHGMKTFVFYCRDRTTVRKRCIKLRRVVKSHKLHAKTCTDREWSLYGSLMAPVLATAAGRTARSRSTPARRRS